MEIIINELREGNFVVLAGGPQSGKSSTSLELAAEILVYKQKGVAIFNLEMSKDWCTKRLVCSDAFTDKDGLVIENLYVDDTPAITVEKIREKCIELKEKYDLGLVVIDYFQLLESKKVVDTQEEKYDYISSTLKKLAQELNVCILILSQLKKQKDRKNAALDDFNLSPYLSRDADMVFSLHKCKNDSKILGLKPI